MKGKPYIARIAFGLRKPRMTRPGVDVAGEVEAVGRNVTQFKPGDKVFGFCRGAFAEYTCAAESQVVMKPANVTFEEAAAVPIAAFTALQGLRDKGKVQPGQKVVINGAAGGVGTLTVQIGKWLGAHVTGVCSTRNAEMVRSIGADRVIDYTRDDFTKGGARYDIIFDLVANHSLAAFRRVLNPRGVYIGAGILGLRSLAALPARLIGGAVWSWFGSQKLMGLFAKPNRKDLAMVGDLMETGKVTPVIDRRYSLSETAEALRYLEEGHARGKVVIRVDNSGA